MKLLYLADAPYIHAQRWIGHFAARGNEVDVVSFRPAPVPGARVHHIDGLEWLGKARYLAHARRVRRLIHHLRPDLVHALHLTSYGFLGALSGYHPLVLTPEGTDILEAPRLTPMHKWLTRYSLRKADRMTATGPHLARATEAYAPAGTSVEVVPYGVDIKRFQPEPRSERKTLVIGTAARMSPEKGLGDLIAAFGLVRRELGERVVLRIAGDGPERRRLEQMAAGDAMSSQIEFVGWLPHERLPSFLQDLDIFVLPSIYEGFGVAAVEASAMALPVVASNVYGIPDVVRHDETGLLVPARDPEALASAISRLARDPATRASMGHAGRAHVAAHYNWDRCTAAMERVYQEVRGVVGPGVQR